MTSNQDVSTLSEEILGEREQEAKRGHLVDDEPRCLCLQELLVAKVNFGAASKEDMPSSVLSVPGHIGIEFCVKLALFSLKKTYRDPCIKF